MTGESIPTLQVYQALSSIRTHVIFLESPRNNYLHFTNEETGALSFGAFWAQTQSDCPLPSTAQHSTGPNPEACGSRVPPPLLQLPRSSPVVQESGQASARPGVSPARPVLHGECSTEGSPPPAPSPPSLGPPSYLCLPVNCLSNCLSGGSHTAQGAQSSCGLPQRRAQPRCRGSSEARSCLDPKPMARNQGIR